MPTYPYACTECGHRFEAVQAFSDESLTVCPVCSGKLRKVFSSVGIVFKGSGFYRTDSRAGAVPKGEAKSEKSTEGKGPEKTGGDKAPSTSGSGGSGSGGSGSGSGGGEKAATKAKPSSTPASGS